MSTTWIPILPSALVAEQEVLKVPVLQHEVALWRAASGSVQIWENRCPHRSVRLSLGYIEGDSLICAYHGWSFDAAHAGCQRIPAQPQQRAPSSVCAKDYPVYEAHGMIWFGGFSRHTKLPPPPPTDLATYAGSLLVHATIEQIALHLERLHFSRTSEYCWKGKFQQLEVAIYLSPNTWAKQNLHVLQHAQDNLNIGLDLLFKLRQQLEVNFDAAS